MIPELQPTALACGKVILLGEHAVVYGQPALAAGLGAGLSLRASPLPSRADPIELSIPAWDIDLRLEAGNEHPVVRACLEVLAYCDGPITGWRIEGEATIPCGAGLGSSAALTVALARLALDPSAASVDDLDNLDNLDNLDDLIAASLVGERVFHGTPSGLDSAVAARGGVLAFRKGDPMESVELAAPLCLVVIPSGIPRQTSVLVAEVRARRARLPEIVDPVLEALGQITQRGRRALTRGDLDGLAELFAIAHELLAALGVSRPALDSLCAAAIGHGARAAKLTGAGGGGCVIALCDNPASASAVVRGLAADYPALAASPATRPFAVEIEP